MRLCATILILLLLCGTSYAEKQRPIGLSGYVFGGQGTERVSVSMARMSLKDKYQANVYGFETGIDAFKLTEKVLDKDLFGNFTLTYKYGKNWESDQGVYYDEEVNRVSLGYKFTPFLIGEVYYKTKDQDIDLIGTDVDVNLDYVGVSLSWRL
jgi:hypothetical protein